MCRRVGPVVFVLVSLLFANLWVPAYAAASISFSFKASDLDLGDALLVGAAALFFGLDSQASVQYRAETGSATSAVSLFYVAGESQSSPDTIVMERKRGHGWGAVAKGKKIPPGLVGKWKSEKDTARYVDKDFETGLNIRFLSTYYGITEDTIVVWVRQGLPVTEVALCLNLAARSRAKPATIVSARLKGDSWIQLSARHKVSIDLIKQPVPPKKTYGKVVIHKKPSDHGKSKGKKK